MKFRRQSALLELIENEAIETQEQLSKRLSEAGFNVTQATVSRDIKDLRLIKVVGSDGVTRYAASAPENENEFSARLRVIFRESVISVAAAGYMVVIKTISGVANAAAASIDSMRFPDIIGTLAGDDTIFIVLKDADAAVEFCDNVGKILRSA